MGSDWPIWIGGLLGQVRLGRVGLGLVGKGVGGEEGKVC